MWTNLCCLRLVLQVGREPIVYCSAKTVVIKFIKMAWSTVSKAFFKSIKTPHENRRLSLLLWIVLTMSIIACWVECCSMPFWTCALKKKHFLGRSYRVKTNQNVVYHGLYSYRQWVHFITPFPSNVFLLLLHVERVCKSFWKEILTRTSSLFA